MADFIAVSFRLTRISLGSARLDNCATLKRFVRMAATVPLAPGKRDKLASNSFVETERTRRVTQMKDIVVSVGLADSDICDLIHCLNKQNSLTLTHDNNQSNAVSTSQLNEV